MRAEVTRVTRVSKREGGRRGEAIEGSASRNNNNKTKIIDKCKTMMQRKLH